MLIAYITYRRLVVVSLIVFLGFNITAWPSFCQLLVGMGSITDWTNQTSRNNHNHVPRLERFYRSDIVNNCHLRDRGLLFGASTVTVLKAIQFY